MNGEQPQEAEIETTWREDAEVEVLDNPETNNDEDDSDDRSAAGMERSSRLTLCAGGGSQFGGIHDIALLGEFTMPLGMTMTSFDLSLRVFSFTGHYKYSESYQWPRRTEWYTAEEYFKSLGGEALLLWRPFRGERLSPFVGVGGRIELAHERKQHDEKPELSPAGRAGLALNLGRVSLNGEIRGGQSSWDLMGSVAFLVGRHIALNGFATHFEVGKHEGKAFGGGLTWVF